MVDQKSIVAKFGQFCNFCMDMDTFCNGMNKMWMEFDIWMDLYWLKWILYSMNCGIMEI